MGVELLETIIEAFLNIRLPGIANDGDLHRKTHTLCYRTVETMEQKKCPD